MYFVASQCKNLYGCRLSNRDVSYIYAYRVVLPILLLLCVLLNVLLYVTTTVLLRVTSCCCSTRAAVLPAAVRQHMPDGQMVAGLLNLIYLLNTLEYCFLSLHSNATYILLYVPLGHIVAHSRSRWANIFGNCGHARSQGGHRPTAWKAPPYIPGYRIRLYTKVSHRAFLQRCVLRFNSMARVRELFALTADFLCFPNIFHLHQAMQAVTATIYLVIF